MDLYIPRSVVDFTVTGAARFLENLDIEIESQTFDDTEREKLIDVMARSLFDPAKRQLYLHRFSGLLGTAVSAMFATKLRPRVVDLGCGSGTVSLLFALLGAEVLALDMDPDLIRACRKRQALYEQYASPLGVHFECCDILSRSFASDSRFDGIYSLFAFNLMQPTQALICKLVPSLAPGGKLVVSDGNRESIYNQLFQRRPVLRPRELESQLAGLGCVTQLISYDTFLPPAVWRQRRLLQPVLWLERAIARSPLARWIGTSYTLVVERGGHGHIG